jgi:hypothetical protein
MNGKIYKIRDRISGMIMAKNNKEINNNSNSSSNKKRNPKKSLKNNQFNSLKELED